MAHGPDLIIADLGKRFAGADAVFDRFSLSVPAGQVVAVTGSSGVGKSTLLRLVAGVDQEFSGAVQISGQPAANTPPPGMVFQDARLLPWLTIARNVQLGQPQATRDVVDHCLEAVGLDGWQDAYPSQLSGGMQRRAALARAMMSDSGLLLLDEPFVSLDRQLAAEMIALVGRLLDQRSPTTLLVTHAADEAAQLADRVVLIGRRPARILGDIGLPVPRAQRDHMTIARYRAQIEAMASEA